MYSQNNEEELILHELDAAKVSKGRFLDIGAYDGKTFSNTLRLVELGWSGVCVEPSPSIFMALLERHGRNPKIQLLNAAISTAARLSPFWDAGGDAVSTISEPHMRHWTTVWKASYRSFHVYTMPLNDLFEAFGYNYDFINIDVEGGNWELFQALPFSKLSAVKVICVEHEYHFLDMSALGKEHGFHPVHSNRENLILSRCQ
jgi:FkbM family methyltransferase